MAKFFSRQGDWIYGGIAFGLFAILVLFAIYAISFVAMRVNDVLRPAGNGEELIVNFDFDKLNQLVGGAPQPPPGL